MMVAFTVLLGYVGRWTTDGRMIQPGALQDNNVEVFVMAPGPHGGTFHAGTCKVRIDGDEIRATGFYDRGEVERCDPLPDVPHGWWATFVVDRIVFDESDEWSVHTLLATGRSAPVKSAWLRRVIIQASPLGVCWEGDDVGLLMAPEESS